MIQGIYFKILRSSVLVLPNCVSFFAYSWELLPGVPVLAVTRAAKEGRVRLYNSLQILRNPWDDRVASPRLHHPSGQTMELTCWRGLSCLLCPITLQWWPHYIPQFQPYSISGFPFLYPPNAGFLAPSHVCAYPFLVTYETCVKWTSFHCYPPLSSFSCSIFCQIKYWRFFDAKLLWNSFHYLFSRFWMLNADVHSLSSPVVALQCDMVSFEGRSFSFSAWDELVSFLSCWLAGSVIVTTKLRALLQSLTYDYADLLLDCPKLMQMYELLPPLRKPLVGP